jgi:hypothetical protein
MATRLARSASSQLHPGTAVSFRRIQGVDRDGGAVQVVVEQAGQCRPLLLVAVLRGGLPGRIRTEQVVQAVTAGTGGLYQVRPGQYLQQVVGLAEPGSGQCGQGIVVQAGPRVQPG